jgi:DNA-binding MarR family transcriptional regulator
MHLAAFRYALRQFLRFSEESARSVGIEPQQHQALLAIKGFPGRDRITISELAERLQIRHHSAVGLVDRLAAQRLVGRESAMDDRRQVYVRLTARGDALLEQLATAHREELRLGSQLSAILERLNGGTGSPVILYTKVRTKISRQMPLFRTFM